MGIKKSVEGNQNQLTILLSSRITPDGIFPVDDSTYERRSSRWFTVFMAKI